METHCPHLFIQSMSDFIYLFTKSVLIQSKIPALLAFGTDPKCCKILICFKKKIVHFLLIQGLMMVQISHSSRVCGLFQGLNVLCMFMSVLNLLVYSYLMPVGGLVTVYCL